MVNCTARVCHQDTVFGTSRVALFVRKGALYSLVIFLPTMAPTTERGKCMKSMIASIRHIVVNGRAAVEF